MTRDGGERRGNSAGSRPEGRLRTELLRLKGTVYDPNTGLYAAAAHVDTIRALIQKTRSLGVVHVEVDPQSRVETVYGWQVLDGVLSKVSGVLQELRGTAIPGDAVICQAGIYLDRFVLFVPQSRGARGEEADKLEEICRLIRERLEGQFGGAEFRSMAPRPTFDVGAVTVTEHPFFRLERQISHGVDEARLAGSKESLQGRTRRHAELKRIIREEQIETLFQPILDLRDETIIGYEAFSRGPRDSMFETPSILFEYSRELGMAGELDLLCQRTALQRARRLTAGNKLFLNALAASLLDPGFREGLLGDLPADFPIAREDIVLEIADRESVQDCESFGTEVTDLRTRGFRVSIDDVGKGASSFESISEVKPDFIKVDTSLIRNIDKNLIKQDVLKSLCHVASAIGAVVVAEGIETRQELDTARRCGATLGQGYLFSRPSRELPARTQSARGEA